MKPSRPSLRRFGLVLALALLGSLWIDWRSSGPGAPPKLISALSAAGPLKTGAARVDLDPKLPATVAGYPPLRPTAEKLAGPLSARAIAISAGGKTIGLLSLEILELPDALARRIEQAGREAGFDAVAAMATHSHTSFGGYDDRLVAEVAGTGRYRPEVADALVARSAEVLSRALQSARPSALQIYPAPAPGLSFNRDDAEVESENSAATLAFLDQEKVAARLVIFAAHPTLAQRGAPILDGDWPSRASAALERTGGISLVGQGALGDISARPPSEEPSKAEAMGEALAKQILTAKMPQESLGELPLGFAEVEFALPSASADKAVPGWLRRPAGNLLSWIAPRSARVAVLRLNDTWLLLVPAEPTLEAGELIRNKVAQAMPHGSRSALVSLAQGYVGYAESPKAYAAGEGEARRVIFGPDLAPRLAEALAVGIQALSEKKP